MKLGKNQKFEGLMYSKKQKITVCENPRRWIDGNYGVCFAAVKTGRKKKDYEEISLRKSKWTAGLYLLEANW